VAEWLHQKNTLPRQQPIETSNHLPLTHTTSFTIWLFNIAMESGPFLDDFPIKTSIYKGFSMAMLNNQMVVSKKRLPNAQHSGLMTVLQETTSAAARWTSCCAKR
jgi:hypothetical protein